MGHRLLHTDRRSYAVYVCSRCSSRLRERIDTFRSLTRLSRVVRSHREHSSHTYRDVKTTLTTPQLYLSIVTAIENPWERFGQLVGSPLETRYRIDHHPRNQLISWRGLRNLTYFNRVRRSASLASLKTYSHTFLRMSRVCCVVKVSLEKQGVESRNLSLS